MAKTAFAPKKPTVKSATANATVWGSNSKTAASKRSTPSRPVHEPNRVTIALGNSLKRLRIARNASQEELAEDAGLDRTFVSRVERGVSNPTLFVLSNLCAALDVTLSELFEPVTANLTPEGMHRRRKLRPDYKRALR